MKFKVSHSGSFRNLERFLGKVSNLDVSVALHKFGTMGVNALESETPEDTGYTAGSWSYQVEVSRGRYAISWHNSHVVDGVPIVILLQFGHGTGTGGYVQGRDFINPALKPIFDQIATGVWNEVKKA